MDEIIDHVPDKTRIDFDNIKFAKKSKASKNKVKYSPNDTKLRDKAALKFWRKHFKEEILVTNDRFKVPLDSYLKKKKVFKDDEKRNFFLAEILKKFLIVVEPKNYPEKKSLESCIDTHGIQYAINIFGPWRQMFEFISKHFFHSDSLPRPLDIFWGKISDEIAREHIIKGNETKSAKKGRYLLRYGESAIICTYIMRREKKKKLFLTMIRSYAKNHIKKK